MSAQRLESDPGVRRVDVTRGQLDRMVGPDGYGSPPVELLEEVLVEVVPQRSEPDDLVTELDRWLSRRVPGPWRVVVQGPFAAGVRSHPHTAALVVGAAQPSQRLDLVHEPRVDAAAGVPVCWVVDLPVREVGVHTGPVEGGHDLALVPDELLADPSWCGGPRVRRATPRNPRSR